MDQNVGMRGKEMKKLCSLCSSMASLVCESDEATLCWGCDLKVHGANFIVNKHVRVLLCHICQSTTPWNGSGPKLVPTVAFCEKCVGTNWTKRVSEEGCASSNHGADEMQNQVVPSYSYSQKPKKLRKRCCVDYKH